MLTILNPATEKVLQEVAEDTRVTIADKFRRAQRAQESWAKQPLSARKQILTRFSQGLKKNVARLAQTLTLEMGKPIGQSRSEIAATPSRIDFFLANIDAVMKGQTVWTEAGLREEIHYEPLGIIGNISAWNYPYFVGTNVFVPALLAGNAVLYKPSEHATLTGLALGELLLDAGLPPDVFIPVVGSGAVGTKLLQQPLNGVFFTGSYGTGCKIAKSTAAKLIKLQLELGGKDPAYVCEDVDIAKTAKALAEGAFYNSGQSCCAVERIYVHQKIAKTFVAEFLKVVRGYHVGDPFDEKNFIGPLARKEQIAVLKDQVRDALARKARVLTGGQRKNGKGFFFEPTVLVNVNHRMKVMREESFGPLIGIQEIQSDPEAIELMNDTDYGLTASVYTRNLKRAGGILSQLNTGTVYVNCCDRVSPRLPWSGRKHSGLGLTLSTEGIRTFTQPKAWHWRSVNE